MRNDVLDRFPDAKRAGHGWTAKCPAHDDRTASLSIGTGDDGRALLHCHAGCSLEDLLAAVHLEASDLFPDKATTTEQIVTTYRYEDAGGAHVFDVCRFSPKDFRQRRADGTWSMKGVRRVLYRLRELQGRTIAYVTEGEKDADRLRAIGLPGTTSPGGAGKWRDAYADQLKAATVEHVVVLPDHDEPGRQHAEQVAASCHAAGLRVKIVALPDLPNKGDVSDYLDAGHTKADLFALAKATARYEPNAMAAPPATANTTGKTHAAKADKSKQGRAVQLEDPEPWPDPVNGAALLDAIAATFERYLALPTHGSTALALWVLHAYAFSAWFTSPFLVLTSPVKRCGKTLLLIVIGALVPRRLYASNVTPAVLFRAIEKFSPTLLIDEADSFMRKNDELRGVLNSGHTRTTATVIRAVGDDHEPRAFSTWCPKVIALIGKLPDTLADRAIEVAMRRRTAGERVERLRQDRIEAECAQFRRQAARWAADHLTGLQDADPVVPVELHDRAADCWRPLLALADCAGARWPALARETAKALSGVTEDADQPAAVLLLGDVRAIFGALEGLSSADVVTALKALDSRPWATWGKDNKGLTTNALARLLSPFEIHPTKIRFAPNPLKGYTRRMFEDCWLRYLTVADTENLVYPPPQPEHRNIVNDSGPKPSFSQPEQLSACSGCETAVLPNNPNETAFCSGVPVVEGEHTAAGAEDDWGRV